MQKKVEIYQSESQVVRDAIDKVVVQVYKKKREEGHKSFLFTGCNVGSGSTYTAINMAVALANAGWKTVLVDCDIRKGMEYKRLNQDITTGLSDYLLGRSKEYIYETNYEDLDYIPCGNNEESPVRLLCTKEMEELDAKLRKDYEFVVYDFPSIDVVPDAGILIPVVDNVILVAAVNETSKKQLESAKAKIKTYKNKYLGVVLNKMDVADYKHYVKDYDYFKSERLTKKHSRDMKRVMENESQMADDMEATSKNK